MFGFLDPLGLVLSRRYFWYLRFDMVSFKRKTSLNSSTQQFEFFSYNVVKCYYSFIIAVYSNVPFGDNFLQKLQIEKWLYFFYSSFPKLGEQMWILLKIKNKNYRKLMDIHFIYSQSPSLYMVYFVTCHFNHKRNRASFSSMSLIALCMLCVKKVKWFLQVIFN